MILELEKQKSDLIDKRIMNFNNSERASPPVDH